MAKAMKSKKNVWKIHDLEKRVSALVQDGILMKDNGGQLIVDTITNEFADQFTALKLKFTLAKLNVRLHEIVWTKKVTAELWNAHCNSMVDVFKKHHPYIPEAMVERELRGLKGVTVAHSITETKAGMGRLTVDALPKDAGKYEFPPNSFHEPRTLSAKSAGCVSEINGALVGIRFTDIGSSPLRRALADARKRSASAVILTNLIDLWTKKTAGFLAVYRAMVSGIQINPDRFPLDYQQEVRDILSGKITDETIYQTLNEVFEEILDGLDKITHRPDDKGPEAGDVPVFLQLCLKEEELIAAATYYELRYMTIRKQKRIEAELTMASSRFAEAKANADLTGMQKWSAEEARLASLKSRVIITAHTALEYEKYRRRFRAYVVGRLEAVIPNCTVISQGSAYYTVGDPKVRSWIIKTSIPSDDKVTSAHLTEAGNTYGYDVFRDTLPDLTLVCPYVSLNFRDNGREDSKDCRPITKYMAVAPSCLDGEFLRAQFEDVTKLSHPVQELVFNPQFKPGITLITWNNDILSYDALPIERLDRNDEPEGTTNYAFPFPATKYLTWFLNSDNHFGAPDKRYIWDPKDRLHRGVTEAAVELMRREGIIHGTDIPIHFTAEMDDATNGDMWFNPRYRPDPRRMMLIKFERWLNQLTNDIQLANERGETETVRELLSEVSRVSIAQMHFTGEDFPFHQMQQVFQRHIAPNIDFYSAVLMRFAKSGIDLTPISQLTREINDDRDLGVHNFPNGNHRIKTLEQKDQEGPYIAGHCREMLKQRPEWRRFFKQQKLSPTKVDDTLEAYVRAPLFGNETYGWGRVTAPGGYPWGVRVHATPARLNSWSDLLDAVIKSDLARGDDSYGLLKYVTVTFYGDKHFYCRAETERMNYVMCAAGVRTNLYGSSGGFPPNNTGVCFVSLPVGGPAEGPIVVRRLSHDFLRDWFAKPTPFNFDTFLPNPF